MVHFGAAGADNPYPDTGLQAHFNSIELHTNANRRERRNSYLYNLILI